jgi:hypothetical protein
MLIGLQSKKCDMFLYIRQTNHSFANRYRPLVSADDISSITKAKCSKRYTKWNSLGNVLFIDVNVNHINVHHFESFTVATMTWLTVMEYLCYTWHRYVSFVVITIRSFPHWWLIVGIVTRVAKRVPHVEQELLTLPEYTISPPVLVRFVLLDF